MSQTTKRKALFIDRDGTINHDCPYCSDPSQIILYDDAIDIMRRYQTDGFLIIIVTNQSGINRGYFSENQMSIFNNELMKQLKERGVTVASIYHCPHRPDENCSCRKPKTGMVEKAARDLHIDIESSVVVGDRDEIDGELARRLNMHFVLLKR